MVPFFVAEFSQILQLVLYLLQNFRTFLKWHHFCFICLHFAQIGSTGVFKATFCIGTFWRQNQKGATFLGGLTPLNPLDGYKKIGNRELNFEVTAGESMAIQEQFFFHSTFFPQKIISV